MSEEEPGSWLGNQRAVTEGSLVENWYKTGRRKSIQAQYANKEFQEAGAVCSYFTSRKTSMKDPEIG